MYIIYVYTYIIYGLNREAKCTVQLLRVADKQPQQINIHVYYFQSGHFRWTAVIVNNR